MNTGALKDSQNWVLAWQTKLHRWTAVDKDKKYDDIYNLAYDLRTLDVAWHHLKANRGSKTAGIDRMTRRYIETQMGLERFLQEIHQDLRTGAYRPQPVREKGIPKHGGKTRYLGIPTIRDRVVQQAIRMVLEPIFEADFYVSSYAYRPGRRAQDAIEEIFHLAKKNAGYSWVIEGDIQGCFDNVHHGILVEEIRHRIADRKIIRTIKAFLKAGVVTELGGFRRSIVGTPQGGILSPLLANIYLSRLDRHFQTKWDNYGSFRNRSRLRKKGTATCYMTRFADDFVVMVKGTREQAESLKEETAQFLKRDLRMELSWEKTRITHISQGFDFLGFHIVLKPDGGGRVGVRVYPSKKSLRRAQEKVKKLTLKSTTGSSLDEIIIQVNRVLRGWTYYFRFAHSKQTICYLGHYAWERVFRWMRNKHRKLSVRVLKRRFFPKWIFHENGQTLFDPSTVKVERYIYRGAYIPTPWNQMMDCRKRVRRGDRLPDEPKLLEYLEECCAN